jgi:hypothetical protein
VGWDITYHPIALDEVKSIYFRGLAEPDLHLSLAKRFDIHEFYVEQLRLRFEEARDIDASVPFNTGHAFYVAIISGFLRKHHYLRGAAFSFLLDDPAFAGYASDWQELVPPEFTGTQFDNRLTENYCGGAIISYESLRRLRRDYASNSHIKAQLDDVFSDGRLTIFWKVVDEAITNKLSLLEASEVVEPDPLNLNASRSRTNLFNCYPDGALLYADTVEEQLREAMISRNDGDQ